MRYSVSTVDREFSPSEAAEITGVSTALQRDWRRRDIVRGNPDGKWTRWTLTDIVELSVMKLFSDAGMEVSATATVASMAVLPTIGALAALDAAVAFDGDDLPEEEKRRIRLGTVGTSHPSHTPGRFLAAFGRGEFDVCRADSLAALEDRLNERARPILSIVDCRTLAHLIVERAGGPVLRYEITVLGAE